MELVLPMYNAHPYFSFKNLDKNVRIIHGKIRYFCKKMSNCLPKWLYHFSFPPATNKFSCCLTS